ncbi:MAG: hypothetical protein PHE83_18570 [Opitutaceae bacterium]|nr:hypothetical protein [Opitutaceae bacterium]
MTTHRLCFDGLIDLRGLNHTQGQSHDAIVQPDGSVHLANLALHFEKPGAVPVGTAVRVWLEGDFVCATLEEINRDIVERAQVAAIRHDAYRRQRNDARLDAEHYNAGLRLPVLWVPGQIDSLGGLSEAADGDGAIRASVVHILLLADLHDERLERRAGNFLCTTANGHDGQRDSGNSECYRVDGDGRNFRPKVSCQDCLRLSRRWTRRADFPQRPETEAQPRCAAP